MLAPYGTTMWDVESLIRTHFHLYREARRAQQDYTADYHRIALYWLRQVRRYGRAKERAGFAHAS